MSDLDSIIEGETEETTATETTETEKEETKDSEKTTDETEDTKVEKDAETTTAKEEDKESWQMAAVLDERRKRQDLERENEELKNQLAKPEERPDVFDDQDGAFTHLESKLEGKLQSDRVNLSRDMMTMLKDDYLEMEQTFVDMAKADPSLTQKMFDHPNPARFAYETAQNKKQYDEIQNVDEYRAKKEAEWKAEFETKMKAELSDEKESEAKKSEADVPSLANASSASGGFATPADESLDEILS